MYRQSLAGMTCQRKGLSFVVCMFTTKEELYIVIYITSSPCDENTRNIIPQLKTPNGWDKTFDHNAECIHDSR